MDYVNQTRLLFFPSLDSTNEEAKRLAQQGATNPIWILADEQTAGRGRRGRTWVSPAGNLMTTLYLPQRMEMSQTSFLSFIAGLSLYDAMHHYTDGLSLKWPNDLLLHGEKISGILLESATAKKNQIDWIAIGMGVNLQHFPPDTPYPATSLFAKTGLSVKPRDILPHLDAAFQNYWQMFQKEGFDGLREIWLARAHGLNETIYVNLPDQQLEGLFMNITKQGALLLETRQGQKEILTGDVFFGKNK